MNPKTIYEKDSDYDGLTDAQELALGTNPHSIDSDGDGHLTVEGIDFVVNLADFALVQRPINPLDLI